MIRLTDDEVYTHRSGASPLTPFDESRHQTRSQLPRVVGRDDNRLHGRMGSRQRGLV